MVARSAGLALLLTLSSCDGCSEVITPTGGAGVGGAGGEAPLTCQGVCQVRYEKLGCEIEFCAAGCTPELLADLEAIGCTDAFLRYWDCLNDFANSCSDGCAEPAGEEWGLVCSDKLDDYQAAHGGMGGGR
jgi:hypothetical protein